MNNSAKGTVLITGASSGIGEAFARRLAGQGRDLVLVARREDRLEALAAELRSQHSVSVEVLPADLSLESDLRRVEQRIAGLDSLTLLINNAGFGLVGHFAEIAADKHEAMIRVHLVATMRLTHAALPGMTTRRRGGIINVSSSAAFFPTTGNVTYGATKACLNAFSEGLAAELRGTGVRVQALCPGFTYTGFHSTPEYAGTDVRGAIPKAMWMTAEAVAEESLGALERNQVICIPGWRYRWAVAVGRNGLVSRLARGPIRRLRNRYRQKWKNTSSP